MCFLMKNSVVYFILIPLFLVFFSCANKNTEGKRLYNSYCINCHQESGKGVGKLIPPISREFILNYKNNMPCIIKYGMEGKIIVNNIEYNHAMPGNNKLSDFDMVNVLNYINEEFGTGENDIFNIEQVREDLSSCD